MIPVAECVHCGARTMLHAGREMPKCWRCDGCCDGHMVVVEEKGAQ